MKAQELLKGALDLLPFSGDKSKLTGWATVYGVIGTLLPGVPLPTDPVTFVVTSAATFALSRLHRWLKRKYPEVKWPAAQKAQ